MSHDDETQLRGHARPEALHIRQAKPGVDCEVHAWPTEGLARRLVDAMRAAHGKGGINVCRDCLTRARASLPGRLAPEP